MTSMPPPNWIDLVETSIIVVDKDGIISAWNHKTTQVSGFAAQDVVGKKLEVIFPGAGGSNAIAALKMGHKDCASTVCSFTTKKGVAKRLVFKVSAQRDINGVYAGAVLFADEAPSQNGHIPRVSTTRCPEDDEEFMDSANTPMFSLDRQHFVTFWNKHAATVTGFTSEDIVGQNFLTTLVDQNDRDVALQRITDALGGKESPNLRLRLATKTGTFKDLLMNLSLRQGYLIVLSYDVTDEVEKEQKVSSIAQELRLLVDTANTPIFGVDMYGIVNEWNNKTAEITGYSREEAMNKPLLETFIGPLFRESSQDVLNNALEGKGTSNYHLEFRTKAGEVRLFLVNATTRRDATNKIVGVVGVAQDVTEAAKHDRAVAAMAHELRQLIDTANAPIFGIDVDGDVNEW
jgi:PAS domain S-box-containing protein